MKKLLFIILITSFLTNTMTKQQTPQPPSRSCSFCCMLNAALLWCFPPPNFEEMPFRASNPEAVRTPVVASMLPRQSIPSESLQKVE